MNIIEAIMSGKAFKRTIWTRDYVRPPFMSLNLPAEDLLAEDWEVEEKKVSLTEAEFEAAVNRTTNSFSMYNPPHICEYLSQLKKELGL